MQGDTRPASGDGDAVRMQGMCGCLCSSQILVQSVRVHHTKEGLVGMISQLGLDGVPAETVTAN